PRYGAGRAHLRPAGRLGVRIETPDGLLVLHGDVPLVACEDGAVRGRIRLAAGEEASLSLVYAGRWPAVVPPAGARAREAIERTCAWWREWASHAWYAGPWRDAVLRSAITLRLLLYAPSGAIIAAPTTSLPERPGGPYNWDYRYCWLRDASLTVRALFGLVFDQQASPLVSWLLHTTRVRCPVRSGAAGRAEPRGERAPARVQRPPLRVLYDVYGRRPAPERELGHLAGYGGARPVRVGNAAGDQLQLDIYGEVIDAAAQLIRRRGVIDGDTRRPLTELGRYVMSHWRLPDAGIRESRELELSRTHSRVLCWTALDRLLMLRAAGHLDRLTAVELASAREQIRREVTLRGWDARRHSYSAVLDGDRID